LSSCKLLFSIKLFIKSILSLNDLLSLFISKSSKIFELLIGITFLLSKLKISTAVRIVQLVLTFVNSELIKLFNSDKVLYLNLSDLYFKNKDLKKGILILKEGVNKFPNFIPLMFNLAIMYRNLGLLDLSIKTHVEILSKDKFNSNSYYELSTMYNFSNHNEQLKTLLDIEIENLSPKDKIYFGYSKANIYHQNKEYKKSSYFLKLHTKKN